MTFLYMLLILLSFLILGAHFLRVGALPLVALSLFLPFLLLLPRPWAARVLQVALVMAGLEWLRTMFILIAGRQAGGDPWGRMAVILGVVALVAFISAATFQLRPLREWYFGREESEPDPADESP
jgi:hypothetical protein